MRLVVASECLLGWDRLENIGQLCACLDCWVIAGFYCVVAFGPRGMGELTCVGTACIVMGDGGQTMTGKQELDRDNILLHRWTCSFRQGTDSSSVPFFQRVPDHT